MLGHRRQGRWQQEDVGREKVVDTVQSDQVSQQSGIGEEDEKDEKEHEGELGNKVTEVFVGVEAIITCCGIHAKVDTWVIHHP